MKKDLQKEYDEALAELQDLKPEGTHPRFSTWYNRVAEQVQSSSLPSLTVPDQSLSIPEILRRFASGQSLSIGNQNLVYTGDVLVPEIRGIDPVDLEQWQAINKAEIDRMEGELKVLEENEKKIAAEKQRQLEERELALTKLLESGTNPTA